MADDFSVEKKKSFGHIGHRVQLVRGGQSVRVSVFVRNDRYDIVHGTPLYLRVTDVA